MYDIPNKIPPSFEKRKEPVEEVKYTPENIWDNMPPEPNPDSDMSDEEFDKKYIEWFEERLKRMEIIEKAVKERPIHGTIVVDRVDFYNHHTFYVILPEELYKEDEGEYYICPLDEEEDTYVNSLNNNSSLIDFLKSKFPFNIID